MRDEDLAAVAGRRNPGGSVNVDSDVTLVCCERLARVNAHPNANRSCGEHLLTFAGGSERVLRRREGDEEGIALRVDLDATVTRKSLP